MSEGTEEGVRQPARQWVVMRNTSMDLRVGAGIASAFPHALRSAIGRPHACALVAGPEAPAELVESLRMNLAAEGFDVRPVALASGGCDLASLEAMLALLAETRVTADDLVCVAGGARTLSVASYACPSWCGGVSLAEVPCDLPSAVAAATTPLPLDAAGRLGVLSQDGSARYTALDLDLFDLDPAGEELPLALALMVQTATCDSDRAFGKLWDASADLAAGDKDAWAEQLPPSVKSRGKVASASSVAIRASLEFGTTFADALTALAPVPVSRAVALADGMRFASRLAVGQENLSIDDMFTIDELLERLGLGTAPAAAAPEPAALVEKIHELRLARTNRFMLAVPRALGRVRLTAITDDLLAEHAAAWCASRPTEQHE